MGDRDGRGAQAVWLQGLYLDPVQRHERAFYQVPSTWHRAGSAKGPFYPGAALPMHTSMRVSRFSHFRLFATLWAVACQASPSKGFSRQEYWSGLPCPPPGILPDPGIEPVCLMSPALAGRFFTTRPSGKPKKEAKCSEHCGRLPPCKMQASLWKSPEMSQQLQVSLDSQPECRVRQTQKCLWWDFPGGPVVKSLHFRYRRHRSHPWSGN